MKAKTNLFRMAVMMLLTLCASALLGTSPGRAATTTYLKIDPADDFESSGDQGGPFTPSSKDYQLTNEGPGSLYWGAGKTADWLDLDPAWGRLDPCESATVTVSLTPAADALLGGVHTDTLTFTDITNDQVQTRGVVLTVIAPEGVLEISPVEDFEPTGPIGGPFTPSAKDYQLTNLGGSILYWGVAKTAGWLDLDSEWGSLDPCESTTVTVSLTAEADSLGAGVYGDTLTFTNLTNGQEQTRAVTLTVYVPPISVSPPRFDVNLVEGLSLTETLTITNNTLEDLQFTIRSRQVGGPEGFEERIAGAATAGKERIVSAPQDYDFRALGESPYRPGEVIIRFAAKADGKLRSLAEKNQILQALGGGQIRQEFGLVPGLCLVELPAETTVEEALVAFNEADGVLYAQPNYKLEALSTVPNDPRFGDLWGMNNTGQTGGTVDADIDAPEAWDISTGNNQVIVAVIDTGVDYTHPDLAANMWVNEAELNGSGGVDDDGNGYVDDIYGYDFCNNDSDPIDDEGHGTHVAGTIGAVGDNSVGVTGICWNVRIMALKFLDWDGGGYTSDAISCIQYSVLMGANLSNNSWGGHSYNPACRDAINAAGAAGMLFVAAAGNDGDNNDEDPHYPSSYDCESIIAVMATDSDDERSVHSGWASNYGPHSVDIGAPGSSILSCQPGSGYRYGNGTSMATPHVAGACALVWSMNPALTNSEVKDILLRTADPTLPEMCVSQGRLNLYRAILETKVPWLIIQPEAGAVGAGDSNEITVTFDAIGMTPGTYWAEIIIIAGDGQHLTKVVPVTMTVKQDDLAVSPREDFESSGTKGGPFTPTCATYTLTNISDLPQTVHWVAYETEEWLVVSPNEGVLEPNETIDVNLCISPAADLLDPNVYMGILIFQNIDSGSIKPRLATLTVKPPDCFTESFDVGENDLAFLSLTFSPDGSAAYYEACRNKATEFPTDPNGGTFIPLWDDDYAEVTLSDGAKVLFYGQYYDRFYIGSNGYITFGQGDTEYVPSLQGHFNLPRISALFTDLAPPHSQCVSFKQLDDKAVVTFKDVPLFGDKAAKNSFQVEMFFADASIRITWLQLAAEASVAGLSQGKGLPPVFFIKSNLSGYAPCCPWGDFNRDYLVNGSDLAILALHWLNADCNIPYWCDKTDLDFSSTVEMVDFAVFADNWMAREDWWLQPVAHWKFDEGEGSIAFDSAGHNDGIIYGAEWTTGQIDGALRFDGANDYVIVSDDVSLDVSFEVTLSAWINTRSITRVQGIVGRWNYARSPDERSILLDARGDLGDKFRFWISTDGTSGTITHVPSNLQFSANIWYHVVGVYNGSRMTLYINGEEDNSVAKSGNIFVSDSEWNIGAFNYAGDAYFDGTIDDIRVYDRALSAQEIAQLYRDGLGDEAFNPYPANGATDIDPNVVLNWIPGKGALSHDVYLGTDYNDVNNATPDSNEYMGNQDANTYDPNGLDLLTTYYWRIDEVTASRTYKGDTWSFTTWETEPVPNLISHWKFDEGEGSIAYDSVGNNHGTIHGAQWTVGQINGALSFDGANDYVRVGDSESLHLTSGATLSAWVNTSSSTIAQGIVGRWNYAGSPDKRSILLDARGDLADTFRFYICIDGTTATYTCLVSNLQFLPNTWYHVAGTYDGTEMKLYIDGQEDNSLPKSGNIFLSNSEWNIGAFDYGDLGHFQGIIDDVRVYNRALYPDEIQEVCLGK